MAFIIIVVIFPSERIPANQLFPFLIYLSLYKVIFLKAFVRQNLVLKSSTSKSRKIQYLTVLVLLNFIPQNLVYLINYG